MNALLLEMREELLISIDLPNSLWSIQRRTIYGPASPRGDCCQYGKMPFAPLRGMKRWGIREKT
jgi:hypothetical protein